MSDVDKLLPIAGLPDAGLGEPQTPPRPWPSRAEVRQFYRARDLADHKVGKLLSRLILHEDLHPQTRADILFWFELHEEHRQ